MKQLNSIALLLIHFYTFSFEEISIKPLKNIIDEYPSIKYTKCFDPISFNYKPFTLSINPNNHPQHGIFLETYILEIPQAYTFNQFGFTVFNDTFIQDLMWKNGWCYLNAAKTYTFNEIIPIQGKVAVISQLAYFNYFHWMAEVLGRLALLEMQNIEYDWLYVPQSSFFMKETLQLWGIKPEKILNPYKDNFCIKADTTIIPSLLTNIDFGYVSFACYQQSHLLHYVREKLLNAALQRKCNIQCNKKIFISRKDAPQRFITNEDEVFALLEQQGFVRYETSKLSVTDQIHLFHNADIIIAPHGAGLVNCIFCKPQTTLIELSPALNDATYCYLAQDFDLYYIPVKTTEYIPDYCTAFYTDNSIPLDIIEYIIQTYINKKGSYNA